MSSVVSGLIDFKQIYVTWTSQGYWKYAAAGLGAVCCSDFVQKKTAWARALQVGGSVAILGSLYRAYQASTPDSSMAVDAIAQFLHTGHVICETEHNYIITNPNQSYRVKHLSVIGRQLYLNGVLWRGGCSHDASVPCPQSKNRLKLGKGGPRHRSVMSNISVGRSTVN